MVIHLEDGLFDRRANFVRLFVEEFAALQTGGESRLEGLDVASPFWNLYKDGNEWLLAYLAHAAAMGWVDVGLRDLFGAVAVDEWNEYLRRNPPWKGGEKELFSRDHRARLLDLLQKMNIDGDIRYKFFIVWDMLADGYSIPCVQTYIHPLVEAMYMAREPTRVREYVAKLRTRVNDIKYQRTLAKTCYPFVTRRGSFHDLLRLLKKYAIVPRTDAGRVRWLQRPVCVVCGVDASITLLSRCGGTCHQEDAVYCGSQCQHKHWIQGRHNTVCKPKLSVRN
jgi:hypothetical protein